jgi:hypothetical protein
MKETPAVSPPSALDKGPSAKPEHGARPLRRGAVLHDPKPHSTKHRHVDGRRECYSRDDE